MKVTVSPVISRGKRRFVVSWTPTGGKRNRLYFKRREEADTEAETLRSQQQRTGEIWLALGAAERDEISRLLSEAAREGFTLAQAVAFYRANRQQPLSAMNAGAAFERFMHEAEASLVSRKTKAALRSNIGRFVAGRQAMPLHTIRREDVLEWLRRDGWGPRTFNTYLISLKTFFHWCVKLRYLAQAPTATIDPIDSRRMPDVDEPPVILNLVQTEKLLEAVYRVDHGLIPFVAVGLFGGLRPEREAGKLLAADISSNLICVRGTNAKDRQRRNVEIHPTLRAWLDLGGELPPRNLRRRFERVREAAGLIRVERAPVNIIRDEAGKIVRRERQLLDGRFHKKIHFTGWAQDCLRHTFASHYLPVFGAEKTIAQLGHGDYNMLFGHYRALVVPAVAEAYWKLTPEKVLSRLRSETLTTPDARV